VEHCKSHFCQVKGFQANLFKEIKPCSSAVYKICKNVDEKNFYEGNNQAYYLCFMRCNSVSFRFEAEAKGLGDGNILTA
jgi:hypothetical protein